MRHPILTYPNGRGLSSCPFCGRNVVAIAGGPGDDDLVVDPGLEDRRWCWRIFPGLGLAFAPFGETHAIPHVCTRYDASGRVLERK